LPRDEFKWLFSRKVPYVIKKKKKNSLMLRGTNEHAQTTEILNKKATYLSMNTDFLLELRSQKNTFKGFGSVSVFNMLENSSRLFRVTTRYSFFSSTDRLR
jgi:hypothetical protein